MVCNKKNIANFKPVKIDRFKKTLKRTYVRKEHHIMNKEELLEYIDNNSTAVSNFKDKVRADQQAKNKKRQPAKQWNDTRIERQVDKFTDEFIGNIYDKLSRAIKANNHTPKERWIKFIEENELLDDLEESVSMIDFEEE